MAEDGEDSSSYHVPVSLPTIPSATRAGIIYDITQQPRASTGVPNHPPAEENESSTNDTAAGAAAGTSYGSDSERGHILRDVVVGFACTICTYCVSSGARHCFVSCLVGSREVYVVHDRGSG